MNEKIQLIPDSDLKSAMEFTPVPPSPRLSGYCDSCGRYAEVLVFGDREKKLNGLCAQCFRAESEKEN